MTKTQALLSGSYIHLDMYRPLSTSMQDMVKTYKEVTECSIMPTSDVILQGLRVNAPIVPVHFVTPEGMNPEFSANIAPMFILDSYAAAVEDGAMDSVFERDSIISRALTAFDAYGYELKQHLDECQSIPNPITPTEVQE